jgi:hypothetical protein
MEIGSAELFGDIPDIRRTDRSLGGANPMHDENLYQILYALTNGQFS